MLEELSQETVAEYANEALTIQEPQGTDYTQGVKVGKTIPAKWWNWLFNAITKRLGQSKTDAQGILSELQNTVTDAGIELDSSDNTQLSQAVAAKTDTQINNYVNKKRWYYSYWHKTSQKLLWNSLSSSTSRYNYSNQGYGVCYIDWDGNNQIQNCSVCIDGTQWYEVPVAQYAVKWYLQAPKCVFFKFKDTYILTIQFRYRPSGTTSDIMSYLMLVSKDALNWTSVAPFGPIFQEVKGIQFFICDDTLYALAGYNAPGYSARSGLYYTSDVTDWDFKAMSYDVGTAPNYDFVYLSHVYKFGAKYLIGNSTFDPVTKEFTVLTAEQYPNAGDRGYVLNGNTAFVTATRYSSTGFYRVTSDGTSAYVDSTLGDPSTDYKVIVNTETVSGLQRLSFSYDGENIVGTLDTQSPLSSCVFVNGYYYVANQRTTDFVNWEPIPNLPQGTFITATGFDNILAVVDSNKHLKYVSYDYAANWVPVTVEAYSVNGELVDGYIEASPTLVHTGNIYFAGQVCLYWPTSVNIVHTLVIYMISDSINRVIGHTLYLR